MPSWKKVVTSGSDAQLRSVYANSLTGSLLYSNVIGKPTLVSGSSQIIYSGISSKPSGILSSSAQIASSISGSSRFNIINVTSNPYTITNTSGEYLFLVKSDSGSTTVTLKLPTVVGNTSKITIKKIGSGSNMVNVNAFNASQKIDTDVTQSIMFNNTSFSIISNNTTAWMRIN